MTIYSWADFMHARPNDAELRSAEASTSELLQRRDAAALEELLRRYRPLMRALAADGLKPALQAKVDTSDIVQEACTQIANSFQSIDCNRTPSFLAYLRQVVINRLLDVQRRFLYSQKRSVRLERADANHVSLPYEDCPLNGLVEQELWEYTEAALDRLPSEIRKLIELRFVNNMTFVQIGELLDRRPDSVRVSLQRWLKRVQRDVQAQYYSSSSKQ